jgi:FixJ family two-component response regulator
MSVCAIESGAIEFLAKPLHEQQLVDAVRAGIEHARREKAKAVTELQKRFDSLTPRERDILTLVVPRRRNKQIAEQLKLSEMTVKVNRIHIMQKMRANSLVGLVRMADELGVSTKDS